MIHRFLTILSGFSLLAAAAQATTYYVDPASGSMSNPGTASQPWSTLEAVFSANKQFATGDIILLRSGYHGMPTVKANNNGMVSIQAEPGQTPKLRTLTVSAASRWDISGLDICPENSAPGAYLDTDLISIQSSASFITVRDCLIRGAFDPTGWTVANWQDRAGNGARVVGPDVTLKNNRFETVGFGIRVNKLAPRILVSRNVIHGFCMDGIQANGDDGIYEYNTITDSYVDDSNHDDFFQAWSSDATGAGTGIGTSYRVTVRGNVFMSRTVPATALSTDPQGIGCFDGMYEGWTVENNLIVTNTYHGISFYGGVDCKIVNNTVVENPFTVPGASRKPPWIQTFLHKDVAAGVPWPVLPSGNLIRNNISSDTAKMVSGGGSIDHNQKVPASSFGTWFTNPSALDFTLKPDAPGVGAGVTDLAPAIDLRELPRAAPYDLGAYEIQPERQDPDPYLQWLIANHLPPDASGDGAPDANPSGDGVSNEMKFALGLTVNSPGLDGRVTAGSMELGGETYLTLTYLRPEPPPAGASYTPRVSADLIRWSATELTELSSTVEGGLRRITLRDTVPVSASGQGRFVRLEVSGQAP